jgi:phosphoglycolate phosphatase-like HAD superfamily hydrolase
MNTLSDFIKTKDYLVCVDSDGCAMDTMDIKHITCFGPCMVAEWGLDAWRDAILTRWNEINLYTLTRGINRFKGLAMALAEIHRQYTPIPGIDTLTAWADTAPELSNAALTRLIDAGGDPIYRKALAWSQAVNAAITALPEKEILPFPGALDALRYAHGRADVAIVSSANREAVLAEWERHGLLSHTDIVLTQTDGSKAHCIAQLLKKGYDPARVLMCGDAPGDLQAAEKNGVFYYPILVRHETASWAEFMDEGLDRLLNGTYAGPYQEQKKTQFINNLGG